jgi:hypothetical protein
LANKKSNKLHLFVCQNTKLNPYFGNIFYYITFFCMKCFLHNNEYSVSQCWECGIFLCKECSTKFTFNWKIVCEFCAEKINELAKIERWKIKTKVILSLLSFAIAPILFLLIKENSFWIVLLYLFFLLIYMWRDIPRPKLFLFWWWYFWFVVIYLYLVWSIFYILLIYPIKNFKYLLKKY